jgi:hypothetical protein
MKCRLDGLIRSLRQGEKMKTLNQLVRFIIPVLLLVVAGTTRRFGQQGKTCHSRYLEASVHLCR